MSKVLKIIGVLILASAVAVFSMNYFLSDGNPRVMLFEVNEEEVNNLELYHTIRAKDDCSQNYVNGTPEVNIGTFNPNNTFVILNSYPGERLKYCSEKGTTSEVFEIVRTQNGYDTEPESIDLGNGYLEMTYTERDDGDSNSTR